MSFWKAIVLGIIQGITEFLPVSSSGHLAIAQYLMGEGTGSSPLLMSILLHFGTLVAVVLCFRKDVWGIIREFFLCIGDLFRGKFHWKNADSYRRMLILLILATLLLFVVLPFKDMAEVLNTNMLAVGIALGVTGILLILSDKKAPSSKRTADQAKVTDAVGIGAVQACAAIFPGLSRSGSTISASLFLGLEREYAVSFSFLLSVPAVLGATLLEVKDAVETGVTFDPAYLVGMTVACAVGIGAIKLVQWLVRSDRFGKFCWYCFAVSALAIGMGIAQLCQ